MAQQEDAHNWETIKENARPLRSGYRVAEINQTLNASGRNSALEDEKR